VAGRAGRADYAGLVVVQSLNLKDPAIQAALNHDYKKFAEGELAIRRKLGLPPFGRLTRLVIQHTKISRVKTVAAELARNLTRIAETVKGVAVIGPNPAVMPRLRNRYRYQILIKCANVSVMRDFLTKIRNDPTAKLMQKEVIIDVDPVDLL